MRKGYPGGKCQIFFLVKFGLNPRDGKLGKSLQILMQFETESAARADGGILLQQIQFPFNGDIRFDSIKNYQDK